MWRIQFHSPLLPTSPGHGPDQSDGVRGVGGAYFGFLLPAFVRAQVHLMILNVSALHVSALATVSQDDVCGRQILVLSHSKAAAPPPHRARLSSRPALLLCTSLLSIRCFHPLAPHPVFVFVLAPPPLPSHLLMRFDLESEHLHSSATVDHFAANLLLRSPRLAL